MSKSVPFVLIPGLACSARLYADQIPALWRLGSVTVANHTAADTMAEIARAILKHVPPRFHLVGLSMDGYISYEILRQRRIAWRSSRSSTRPRAPTRPSRPNAARS